MAPKVVIALPCSSFKCQVRAKAKTTLLIACKFKYRVSVPPGKIQTQRPLCVSTYIFFIFFTRESNRGSVPQPPGKTQVCHPQLQGQRYLNRTPASHFHRVRFYSLPATPIHSHQFSITSPSHPSKSSFIFSSRASMPKVDVLIFARSSKQSHAGTF